MTRKYFAQIMLEVELFGAKTIEEAEIVAGIIKEEFDHWPSTIILNSWIIKEPDDKNISDWENEGGA